MFTESAALYDALHATFKDYAGEAAALAAMLRREHPACRSVLDVACGTGEHVRLLGTRHGFAVDGLDLDSGLLEIAARKCPASRFWRADMTNFELPTRYDAVLCLFGSIGYVRTLDRLQMALRRFRAHLAPEGVIVVEPWFAPGVLDPSRVMSNRAAVGSLTVERMSRLEIADRLSRIYFEYRLEDDSGVRTTTEVHELGLFTGAEMIAAFEATALAVRHDEVGLDGRGLYLARACV